MVEKPHGPNNLTDEGRRKGHEALVTRIAGWPHFIKDDKKREAHITKKMNGRRYDEPGMEVKFKDVQVRYRTK